MIATTEYERVQEDVGVAERRRGVLRLDGREVGEFLEGQVTNDVEALEPGTGCYAALLTHKGKMRTDLRILRGDGWFLLDTEPVGLAPLKQAIETYSLGRDVRLEDQTGERAVLALLGPRARDVVDPAPAPEEHSFVEGEHGLYVATDLGVDVICPAAAAADVEESLGVEPVSAETAECLRIEAGRPRYGLDMDAETIPEEAGLNDRAVSFTKGCYLGQETVARLHYKGKPNRHLRGLRLSAPAEPGDPVALDGKLLGTVGSACISPTLGPIALAIVRREAAPGDEVVVGRGARGAVVELPFQPGA